MASPDMQTWQHKVYTIMHFTIWVFLQIKIMRFMFNIGIFTDITRAHMCVEREIIMILWCKKWQLYMINSKDHQPKSKKRSTPWVVNIWLVHPTPFDGARSVLYFYCRFFCGMNLTPKWLVWVICWAGAQYLTYLQSLWRFSNSWDWP